MPGIDPYGMDIIVRGKSGNEFGPGLAKIRGLENVRCEVVGLVAFDGDVGRPGIARRSLDHAHRAPLRHGFRGNVLPVLAAVACELNQSVVGAYPDQIFLDRRFHYRKDRVIDFDTGVVLGNRTAGTPLFRLVIAREVGTDDRPTHSGIGGLEQDFTGEVHGFGIMRGKNDGLRPLEAMFDVTGSPPDRVHRPGVDGLFFAGAVIVARNLTPVGAGIHDLRVDRIGRDVATFAAAYVVPVGAIDGAVRARAGDGHGGIVLLSAVHVIGKPAVGDDVIKLGRGLVIDAGPSVAAVDGDDSAAIVAVDHPPGIRGIDPERVIISVWRA